MRHDPQDHNNRITLLSLVLRSSVILTIVSGWLASATPAAAAVPVTLTPLTWNMVGLDSNNVNVGPNIFPVGVRACNPDPAVTFTNVQANFVWLAGGTEGAADDDTIKLRTGTTNLLAPSPAVNLAATNPDTCYDFYYEVEITRSATSYDKTRRYRIDVTYADDTGSQTVSTPTPREIYVEHLVSQNRNSVEDVLLNGVSVPVGGTLNLVLGNTYTITLQAKTATNGYEQIESFINFKNTIFQILSVTTTYTAYPVPDTDPLAYEKMYADGCGWVNDPTNPNYHTNLSCTGVGKYGDQVTIDYVVKIIDLGPSEPLSTLIYDYSGSSYHYNSDFPAARFVNIVQVCSPSQTIAKWTFAGFPGSTAASTDNAMGTPAFAVGAGLTSEASGSGNLAPAPTYNGWSNNSTVAADDYYEFDVSTLGYYGISLGFDAAVETNTGSNGDGLRVWNSTDGDWTNAPIYPAGQFGADNTGTTTTWGPFLYDMASVSALDNNANAEFRVAAFNLQNSGTWFGVDNVEIKGCPLPTSVVVVKDAQPNDAQDFDFTASGLAPANFTLDDDGDIDPTYDNIRTFSSLTPGFYQVSEDTPLPAGWTLQGPTPTCDSSFGDVYDTPADNINLNLGETISCTFVNTKAASITIIKDAVPNHAQDFAFTGDLGAFALDDDGAEVDNPPTDLLRSVTFSNQSPGVYAVTETLPVSGWNLTDISCDGDTDLETTVDTATGTATIDLDAGEDITCTFTNTKQSSITIVKEATPESSQSFNFNDVGTDLLNAGTDFELVDDGDDGTAPFKSQTFSDLPAGSYEVSEDIPPGWALTDITCTGDTDVLAPGSTWDVGLATAYIDLDQGEDLICTFTNESGHIIVDKVTNPAADPQTFSFDAVGGSYTDFGITDAGTPNDQSLAPGSYSVSELTPAGWSLTDTTCQSTDTGDTSTADAITLNAGETITCTFTNTKLGEIVVVKDAVPNGNQAFTFNASGPGGALTGSPFDLDDDGSDTPLPSTHTFSGLEPGSYAISETEPNGWEWIDTTCVSSLGDTETADALELDAGETITCTFTNEQLGTIVAVKEATPEGSQVFNFNDEGTDLFNGGVDFGLVDDGDDANAPYKSQSFPNLPSGSYAVSEDVPTGWSLTDTTCVSSINDTEAEDALELDPGETITCTFTNVEAGTIIIVKEATPEGSQVFNFNDEGTDLLNGGVDFGLVDDGDDLNAPFKSQTFSPLPAGTYAVSEDVPTGWSLTDATCVSTDTGDLSTIDNISLSEGETITCTFTNTADSKIVVDKVTDPSGDLTNFDFAINDLSGPTEVASFSLADADTPHEEQLSPGNYDVMETVPTGWSLGTPSCVSSLGDTEVYDDLDLNAGEVITCTFTNTLLGSVTIAKQATPEGATTFNMNDVGTDLLNAGGDFGLVDDGDDANPPLNAWVFTELDPGSYAVSEDVPDGWALTGLGCVGDDDLTPEDFDNATATIDLDAGEDVTCTFTNEQRGQITIVKEATPEGATNFNMHDVGTSLLNGGVDFGLVDDGDDANPPLKAWDFTDLDAGSYAVQEDVPAGWALTSLTCVGDDDQTPEDLANATATIDLDIGEDVTCTFTNTAESHIIVDKVTDPAADPTVFDFTVTGAGYSNFTLTDAGAANDQTLAAGAYSVSETVPSGWSLATPVCVSSIADTETAGSLELDAGETITCTFTNTLLPVADEFTKILSNTNQLFTDNNDVAIGEQVEYTVTIEIGPGDNENAVLVDTLGAGLAFMQCDSISATGGTAPTGTTFAAVCDNPTVGPVPDLDGDPVNQARKVTFSFGTINNPTTEMQTMTVVYTAVVLNSDGNQGVPTPQTLLANSAQFTWDPDNSFDPESETVVVVEPDLQVIKAADPTVVGNGTALTYTLTVSHTSQSQADAFDLVLVDILPMQFDFVSFDIDDGTNDPQSCTYDVEGPRWIYCTWPVGTEFDLLDTGVVRVNVVGNSSLAAGSTITNTANVGWSSLPGDVSDPQPNADNVVTNQLATERWYDPAAQSPVYTDEDSVNVRVLGGPDPRDGFELPVTGFPPGQVSAVSDVPDTTFPAAESNMLLEIPALRASLPIVGIPLEKGNWNLESLWNQAGWLQGSAYPTYNGNSVLTAHVVTSDGKPGPFGRLNRLKIGDQVRITSNSFRYIYTIRSSRLVQPNDLSVLRHRSDAWLTLLTCDRYDPLSGKYLRRLVVEAQLVLVERIP